MKDFIKEYIEEYNLEIFKGLSLLLLAICTVLVGYILTMNAMVKDIVEQKVALEQQAQEMQGEIDYLITTNESLFIDSTECYHMLYKLDGELDN